MLVEIIVVYYRSISSRISSNIAKNERKTTLRYLLKQFQRRKFTEFFNYRLLTKLDFLASDLVVYTSQ